MYYFGVVCALCRGFVIRISLISVIRSVRASTIVCLTLGLFCLTLVTILSQFRRSTVRLFLYVHLVSLCFIIRSVRASLSVRCWILRPCVASPVQFPTGSDSFILTFGAVLRRLLFAVGLLVWRPRSHKLLFAILSDYGFRPVTIAAVSSR